METKLAHLGAQILDEFSEGRYPELERDFAELIRRGPRDMLVFTYAMIGVAQEAAGAKHCPPGLVAVPRVAHIEDDGTLHQVEIEDAPLAARTYARLVACVMNGDLDTAKAIWAALLHTPGGLPAMNAVASFALQEAHLQAVVRPVALRGN